MMTEAELELEHQKLALERERMNATIALQTREAEARQKERRSEWLKGMTPAGTTLLVELVGGLVALFQAQSQSEQQLRLEEAKARNGLILQAMQTGDVKQASQNLLFLAKNGIIDLDIEQLRQSLEEYQPALPPTSGTPYARFEVPEKLASAEWSLIDTVHVPPSSTTVKAGNYGSRSGEAVVGIVLHNVSGPEASVDYMRTSSRQSSLHWMVLPSGEIVPLVDEKEAAFHIGGSRRVGWTNSTTIGVGVAGEAPLTRPIQAAALYRLLADICNRANLPVTAILSHDAVDPRKKETLEPHMGDIRHQVAKVLSKVQTIQKN